MIVQAGASGPGREFAASAGEVIYCMHHTKEDAKEYYDSVKGSMAKYGRSPESAIILPGITPVVGRTEAEAQEKREWLASFVDPLMAAYNMTFQVGDLSGYPLDGPVPELPNPEFATGARLAVGMSRRENLSIRQVSQRLGISANNRQLVGTPKQIADNLEDWFTSGVADGFNVCPTHQPGGFQDFCELVVPELQRRGLFRTEYEAETLRGNLGLAVPENRYTKARREQAK